MTELDQLNEEVPDYLVPAKPVESVELFLRRTEHAELIADIIRNLTGIEFSITENGNLIPKPTKNQGINMEGARKIFTLLKLDINTVTSMTNFTDDHIKEHLTNGSDQMAEFLMTNYKEYKFNKEFIWPFAEKYTKFLHAQLNIAKDGNENKVISQPLKHTMITMNQGQKRSFLGIGRQQPPEQQTGGG